MYLSRSNTNSRQLAAFGGTVASSALGLLGATAAGFLDVFDEDLANIIESIDLSNTPLSPFSGVQDFLVTSLQGIGHLTIMNRLLLPYLKLHFIILL